MSTFKNFVTVDWRSGEDRIYFFFKDSNTFTRFNLRENQVPPYYPRPIASRWSLFTNARNLRFGFTTTGFDTENPDDDILWLFDHYTFDGSAQPAVRKYDQDTDTSIRYDLLEDTRWRKLAPYFDKIIAGTWWQTVPGRPQLFRFLLNDGRALRLDFGYDTLVVETLNEKTWPGLSPYKDRMITAAQNDRPLADSYLYIFLTDNEYIRYNIQENRVVSKPIKIDAVSWPGLSAD